MLRRSAAITDLFAILKSTEKLERAYVRDAISAKEYEPLCSKLIGQYKTLYESLRDQVMLAAKTHCMGGNDLGSAPSLHSSENFHAAPGMGFIFVTCWRHLSNLNDIPPSYKIEGWQYAYSSCCESAMDAQVPDVQQFMVQYNMQCPMATKRLIFSGMPATVEHGKPM